MLEARGREEDRGSVVQHTPAHPCNEDRFSRRLVWVRRYKALCVQPAECLSNGARRRPAITGLLLSFKDVVAAIPSLGPLEIL